MFANENSGGGVSQESSVVVVGPGVCVRGVDTAGRGEVAAAQTKKYKEEGRRKRWGAGRPLEAKKSRLFE